MTKSDGRLIIVSTPIGNLGDITLRALEALKSCDAVYAEDTRVTSKLLSAYEIKKPLFRLDENTIREESKGVVNRVLSGETVCYCTDAGMPGVSDPGSYLINAANQEGAAYEVLPGPSAATLAYVSSGFSCPRYYFGGFFPRKEGEQRKLLCSLKDLDAALVFYESPYRLVKILALIKEELAYRQICICRELTKVHEQVFIGRVDDAYEAFKAMEDEGRIKGEIALVIDSFNSAEQQEANERNRVSAEEMACRLLGLGERVKDVADKVSKTCGISKNDAYKIALAIKGKHLDD